MVIKMISSHEWNDLFDKAYGLDNLQDILTAVEEKRKTSSVFPKKEDVFKAFDLCRLEDLKVIILGQDPYYNEGQANGLSFSVNRGVKLPASLKNIFKELNYDIGIPIPNNGDLSPWARQGILLLNTTLTVEEKKPNSHKDLAWSDFTNAIIKYLSDNYSGLVFVLWGNFAQKKEFLINEDKHLIIKSSHPSPLSARHSFFSSKPFSRINSYLRKMGKKEIKWGDLDED